MEATENSERGQSLAVPLKRPVRPLVACPMCGAAKGYTLSGGSTYRWWRVACADCGRDIGECRSDGRTHLGGILPDRCASADDEWNEAGAYAERLRAELAARDEQIVRILKHRDEQQAYLQSYMR